MTSQLWKFDRWHPFSPLGLPHAVIEDDIYEGMLIPAGSTVIANIQYVDSLSLAIMPRYLFLQRHHEEYQGQNIILFKKEKRPSILLAFSKSRGIQARTISGCHWSSSQELQYGLRLWTSHLSRSTCSNRPIVYDDIQVNDSVVVWCENLNLIIRILWAFNIIPLKCSPSISDIQARHGFWGSTLTFPYELVSRSDRARFLIEEQAAIAREDIKKWEVIQL